MGEFSESVVASFKGHNVAIRSVEFGPNGRWLASASQDRTIRLFDTQGQRERSIKRSEAIAGYQQAASIIDDLFAKHKTTEDALETMRTGHGIDTSALPYVQRQLLMRSLEVSVSR